MPILSKIVLLLLASVVAAAAVPIDEVPRPGQSQKNRNDKRQSKCENGTHAVFSLGPSMVCVADGTKADWAFGAAILSIGSGSLAIVINAISNCIRAKRSGSVSVTSGANNARRGIAERDDEDSLAVVTFGDGEVTVPFALGADGKTTIDLLDLFSQSASSLTARDTLQGEALVEGGSAIFHANGTLDTFSIEFAVASSAPITNTTTPTLSKRDYWALHTTYWAEPSHASTSLKGNQLHDLVEHSYRNLPQGVSQVCGYMANSGTWHGAFRHWTGDKGYTIGECESSRKYK
ncbi:uncharacterized protein JCM15063_002025 [Sporobolomyces koalae]|uniref:uncharacterized protein n=1 Tax=Sporobolomyces koalae TaxID=500713 RepID=UPI00317FFBA6